MLFGTTIASAVKSIEMKYSNRRSVDLQSPWNNVWFRTILHKVCRLPNINDTRIWGFNRLQIWRMSSKCAWLSLERITIMWRNVHVQCNEWRLVNSFPDSRFHSKEWWDSPLGFCNFQDARHMTKRTHFRYSHECHFYYHFWSDTQENIAFR